MNIGLFDFLPIELIYFGIAILILVSCEAGYQLGTRTRKQDQQSPTTRPDYRGYD